MKHPSSARRLNQLSLPLQIINHLFLGLMFLSMLIPFLYVFAVAFSTRQGSMAAGVKLWPDHFSLDGFRTVWERADLGTAFVNSLSVSAIGVLLELFLSLMAAYVLVIEQLPLRRWLAGLILVTLTIPGDLTLISVYVLNKQLSLLNSYPGLILNGLVSGFAIMLLKNYFEGVPGALAEAARIDSATEFQIFRLIYLPLSLPGIAAISFLEFISKWNALMLPATIISDAKYYTLPLVLKQLTLSSESTSGIDYIAPNARMAAIVISVIPLILLYVLAQNFLIEGLTLGATKG
ncbi:carbohydrate ABC transporter permease [Oscillospiraceae bacterium HV4-5-C5C]|nr:carbohydrate ABC transporter permease [Oscillospiraceae bacterium HV4-5-C5C]